jgi:hypothetical protein
MYARWGSFAVGLGLVFAPLVLGYAAVGPILQHVAAGLLVCVASLAALEWPAARFALAVPAAWLLVSARSTGERAAAVVEVATGALLVVLALFPSGRLVPRADREEAGQPPRAGARA